jgi:hypothetical protein
MPRHPSSLPTVPHLSPWMSMDVYGCVWVYVTPTGHCFTQVSAGARNPPAQPAPGERGRCTGSRGAVLGGGGSGGGWLGEHRLVGRWRDTPASSDCCSLNRQLGELATSMRAGLRTSGARVRMQICPSIHAPLDMRESETTAAEAGERSTGSLGPARRTCNQAFWRRGSIWNMPLGWGGLDRRLSYRPCVWYFTMDRVKVATHEHIK